MAMKNPPHPGYSIKENCLLPLGLNVTKAAQVLGVARHTLSRVLNGHAAISPEMAIRLKRLDGPMQSSGYAGKPPTTWLRHAAGRTGLMSSDTSRSRK